MTVQVRNRRALTVRAAVAAALIALSVAAFGGGAQSSAGAAKASGCNRVYEPFISHGCSKRFVATDHFRRARILRTLPQGATIVTVWVSEGYGFVSDRKRGCWSVGRGNGLTVGLGVHCKGKPDVIARYKARRGGPTPVRLIWQVNR
jgi:hypothetical protein